MKKIDAYPGVPAYDPKDPQFKVVPEDFGGETIDVIYRKGKPGIPLEEVNEKRARGEDVSSFAVLPPFRPRTYEAAEGIVCQQEVPVPLRDGVIIYADIYRPKDAAAPLPLIISWGPFGKRAAEGQDGWKLMGVPPGTVSTLAKFEAADPSYWCRHGYAVANVDPRGIGHSEGDMSTWGVQDGKDGYDFIEWAAVQDWCNGKCALFGNSGVAMVQWKIAAEQPPHLACFAAWEGTGDFYRESFAPGGIPAPDRCNRMISTCTVANYAEDSPNMLVQHPYIDPYWEAKIPNWKNIKAPAYIAAGWCHIHLRGSIEAFRRIRSPKKWLRIHRDMEWPDTYNPNNLADLKNFFDRYLRDVRNGWEFTPRVRMEVMDAYSYDYSKNRPEKEFPLKRTEYKKLYLDAKTGALSCSPYEQKAEVEYDPERDITSFTYVFPEETEISGFMKLHLHLECRGYDNTDLFVWVKKYSASGEYVPLHCMDEDWRGAWGYFRGARRELDPKWSSDFQPVQAHWKDEPMEAGVVYPCDIEIWPHSRIWHKGERLCVEISGHYIMTEFYEDAKMCFLPDNGPGKAVIHTGGEYDSFLQIPVIPPKYQVGDYIYRG